MKEIFKHVALVSIGGCIYYAIEILWRGYSHWSMFLLGGICFLFLGMINEVIPWKMELWKQAVIGTVMITFLEFVVGCVVNLWLGWNVWNYSNVPFNILGQICLPYMILWMPLTVVGIIIDDCLRHFLFGEEKPHYTM